MPTLMAIRISTVGVVLKAAGGDFCDKAFHTNLRRAEVIAA
jgi:hypothetical protein